MKALGIFDLTKDYVQRRRAIRNLRDRRSGFLKLAELHRQETELSEKTGDKTLQNVHETSFLLNFAHFRRCEHEINTFETGKNFWETHNIEEYKKICINMKNPNHIDNVVFFNEIPSDALQELKQLVEDERRDGRLAQVSRTCCTDPDPK